MSKSYMVVIYAKVPYMVARALVLIEKLGFFKVQVVVEHAAQQGVQPTAAGGSESGKKSESGGG